MQVGLGTHGWGPNAGLASGRGMLLLQLMDVAASVDDVERCCRRRRVMARSKRGG